MHGVYSIYMNDGSTHGYKPPNLNNMPSGGKREGAGRPKVNTKQVLFRLTESQEIKTREFVKNLKDENKDRTTTGN